MSHHHSVAGGLGALFGQSVVPRTAATRIDAGPKSAYSSAMFTYAISFLSVLLVVAFSPSCAPGPVDTSSSWTVQLKISGGFTGRGNGSLWVASDGKYK